MPTFRLCTVALPMLGLVLACCTQTDPYVRPGEWHPLGANDENLRAMVADQTDLYAGRGAALSPGDEAAAAVVRLRLDRAKPLPASSLSDIKVNDTAPAPGPSAASAAAPVSAGGAAPAAAP